MHKRKSGDRELAALPGAGGQARIRGTSVPAPAGPLSEAERLHYAGVQALAGQRVEDAVIAFRGAVELDPCLGRAWSDLAVVMEALGNPGEAKRCHNRAVSTNLSEPRRRQAFRSSLL